MVIYMVAGCMTLLLGVFALLASASDTYRRITRD